MRKEKKEELASYVEELKTLRKELVEGNRFLDIERYKCFLNGGRVVTREKIIKGRGNGDASIILPITVDNNVILTVQPRVFTKNTVGISLPAGYVDFGETHLDAAKRELLEETGYNSKKINEVCHFYQDDGCSPAFNKGFIAEDCIKVADQSLDKDEFIRFFECRVEELLELYDSGYILDVGSQFTIEKAKEFLKKRG